MSDEIITVSWASVVAQDPLFTRPELLTHPQIPGEFHGFNPRSVMGRRWWHKVRWAAFAKNNYCCWACGVHRSEAWKHQWLEGHEVYDYQWEKGRIVLSEVVGLCFACHSFIHDGHLAAMCMSGKITRGEENHIRQHGWRILKKHNLIEDRSYRHAFPGYESAPPWKQFLLIVEDKEFLLQDFREGKYDAPTDV